MPSMSNIGINPKATSMKSHSKGEDISSASSRGFALAPGVKDDRVKNEATQAMKEFERFVKEEEDRIKVIAEEENERVMKILREKQEDVSCPLCLEELPAITPMGETSIFMICCGTRLCMDCGMNWRRRQVNAPTCIICRRPISLESLKELAVNGGKKGKAFALSRLGDFYLEGSRGMKQDFQKAVQCFERAAELGDPCAQSYLAREFYHGKNDFITRSIDKAKELAEQGVRLGHPKACTVLGWILKDQYGNINKRSLRLFSIGAFQHDSLAMVFLGEYYHKQLFEHLKRQGEIAVGGMIEFRKTLILAIYWYGKALEQTSVNSHPAICMRLIYNLDLAVKVVWHHESLSSSFNPLTGYSHLPFVNWLLKDAKKKNLNDEMLQDPRVSCVVNGPWKSSCVQCGKTANNKIKLKTCARCRIFPYCSKECQTGHWKAGHKVDCKEHWVERFFPDIRSPKDNGG